MIVSFPSQAVSTWAGPLLAASPRTADTGQLLAWLIGAAVVISSVCAVLIAVTRYLHERRTNSHAGLFAGLCKCHGLDRSSRALLARVVRHWRLKEPGRVFLEPQLLDPAKLASIAGGNPRRIVALRTRLFANEASPGASG